MMLAMWAFVGVVLALGLLRLAGRRGPEGRRRTLAVGLLVAAAIYVPFALVDGDGSRLLVELGGVALFAVPAWLGLRGRERVLAVGWLAHLGWDWLLHLAGPAYGPGWYAGICLGFDLVVAGGLLVGSGRSSGVNGVRTGSHER